MTSRTERVLDALCKTGRKAILDYGISVDSCIASSRIALEVLRRLGISAGPVAVKMAAYNEKGHQAMLAGHPEWVRTGKNGAYGIGIGWPTDGPGWDGHLVLIVERQWLLDMSIDQASRPQRGVVLRPFYTRKDFFKEGVMLIENPNGGTIRYELDPDNKAWKDAADWNLRRWNVIVNEILKAVKGAAR